MTRLTLVLWLILLVVSARTAIADVVALDNVALERLRAEGVAIIDVRRQDEWETTGLVAGSHPMTFFDAKGRYDAEAWLEKLDKLVRPDEPLVLICAHGVRSAKIAEFLDKRLGYTQVYNVTKGISAWLADKRPVEPLAQ
ncbi:MAG: rhodanese-like domain-containing protein [Granulosicoccus sp.]